MLVFTSIFACDIILQQTGKTPVTVSSTYFMVLEKRFNLEPKKVLWLVLLGKLLMVLSRNFTAFPFFYQMGLQYNRFTNKTLSKKKSLHYMYHLFKISLIITWENLE